ncbi:hypothetical protein ACFE04_003569 [Oxalis oulophora]
MEKEDLISQLPEEAIHNIMRRLPMEECNESRLLSKVWHRFWSSNPNFEFDMGYRYAGSDLDNYVYVDSSETLAWFSFINNRLQKSCFDRNQTIDRLKLTIWMDKFMERNPRVIDQLLALASKGRVKDFVLRLLSDEGFLDAYMPIAVLSMKTNDGVRKPHDVDLPLLRKLVMRYCGIDEKTLEKLIHKSPLLTTLELHECFDKYYKSAQIPKFEIRAPNLEMFLMEERELGMKLEIGGHDVEKISLAGCFSPAIVGNIKVKAATLEKFVAQGCKDLKIEIDATQIKRVHLDKISGCTITFKVGGTLKEMTMELTSVHAESQTLKLEFDVPDKNTTPKGSPSILELELQEPFYVLKRYLGASLTHEICRSFQKGSGSHKLDFFFSS